MFSVRAALLKPELSRLLPSDFGNGTGPAGRGTGEAGGGGGGGTVTLFSSGFKYELGAKLGVLRQVKAEREPEGGCCLISWGLTLNSRLSLPYRTQACDVFVSRTAAQKAPLLTTEVFDVIVTIKQTKGA